MTALSFSTIRPVFRNSRTYLLESPLNRNLLRYPKPLFLPIRICRISYDSILSFKINNGFYRNNLYPRSCRIEYNLFSFFVRKFRHGKSGFFCPFNVDNFPGGDVITVPEPVVSKCWRPASSPLWYSFEPS